MRGIGTNRVDERLTCPVKRRDEKHYEPEPIIPNPL